ncbi:MAG: GtrA family protein [Sedimentibacter sp.]|nr:GtrA family protein [Sedimentibacter sp.]
MNGLPEDNHTNNIKDNKNIKKETIRGLKFTLFSLSAGIIEIASFTLLNELTGWPYWACYLTALVLSVLWNFTLNRRYTFRSSANVSSAMFKTFLFYLVFTPVSTFLGDYLADTLMWNEYLVTILIMVSNFILEFLYQRFYVFRKSIDTNELAKKKIIE